MAEQNSLDLTWDLLMEDRFKNIRNTFLTSDEEMRRFRAVLVNVVLATDIFDKDLNDMRKERWEKAFASGKAGMIDHDERDALRSSIVIEHSTLIICLNKESVWHI